MDREILFQGKRLDNGEWVEGCYAKAITGQAYILPESSYISFEYQTIAIGGFVEVTPSTVGQYTGLTDKNGKKIFKGDVLRLSKGSLCVVKHGNRYRQCGFVVGYVNGAWDDVDNINGHDPVEVIGNIHNNPELMGGEGDG